MKYVTHNIDPRHIVDALSYEIWDDVYDQILSIITDDVYEMVNANLDDITVNNILLETFNQLLKQTN